MNIPLLECIVVLLETIVYQGTARTINMEPYLRGLYAAYRARNPEDATSREELIKRADEEGTRAGA